MRTKPYSLVFLFLVSCGKPSVDNLADEFSSLLEVEAQHKFEEAEAAYTNIYQWAQNIRWPETVQADARKSIEKTNIDEVHAIATRFYFFLGSFRQTHESGSYRKDELLAHFKLSVDSILNLTPGSELSSIDYSSAEKSKYIELICPQLEYDMAVLEKNAMDHLAKDLPSIIYDEFPDWGADTLRVMSFWYVKIKPPKTSIKKEK